MRLVRRSAPTPLVPVDGPAWETETTVPVTFYGADVDGFRVRATASGWTVFGDLDGIDVMTAGGSSLGGSVDVRLDRHMAEAMRAVERMKEAGIRGRR